MSGGNLSSTGFGWPAKLRGLCLSVNSRLIGMADGNDSAPFRGCDVRHSAAESCVRAAAPAAIPQRTTAGVGGAAAGVLRSGCPAAAPHQPGRRGLQAGFGRRRSRPPRLDMVGSAPRFAVGWTPGAGVRIEAFERVGGTEIVAAVAPLGGGDVRRIDPCFASLLHRFLTLALGSPQRLNRPGERRSRRPRRFRCRGPSGRFGWIGRPRAAVGRWRPRAAPGEGGRVPVACHSHDPLLRHG